MTYPTPKNTICLWFDGAALEAAQFYARTFPDSAVRAVHQAPADYPMGQAGDVLTVEFTVMGIPCLGLNGGPLFPHTEAFSFQVATDDQLETNRLWDAIVGSGGQASACGWCKDRGSLPGFGKARAGARRDARPGAGEAVGRAPQRACNAGWRPKSPRPGGFDRQRPVCGVASAGWTAGPAARRRLASRSFPVERG